ncbi:CLC_0170 family protein [Paenibacillus piscarius]|uniref:CLC_0170 family protein n=1 Tax=Paenibacillus piscarius TaxID=1089681 RepID=UPI001EE8F33B|nr:CLC_0170 family protein [Paenibacillus piscarius]
MIRVMGTAAGLLMFCALLLLTVDYRIYSNRGWIREQKSARLLAWGYGLLSLLIFLGIVIYI